MLSVVLCIKVCGVGAKKSNKKKRLQFCVNSLVKEDAPPLPACHFAMQLDAHMTELEELIIKEKKLLECIFFFKRLYGR